ncbi:unnamed protein product [Amaranthus hypochondriacus]
MENLKNLSGLSSRVTTTPNTSIREMGIPLREKVIGLEEEEAEKEWDFVKELKSNARSLTLMLWSGIGSIEVVVLLWFDAFWFDIVVVFEIDYGGKAMVGGNYICQL